MGNDNKSIIEMLNLGAVKGSLVRSGVCTPNEARETMGLPPIDYSDAWRSPLILIDQDCKLTFHSQDIECQYCGRLMVDDWNGGPCPGCGGRVR